MLKNLNSFKYYKRKKEAKQYQKSKGNKLIEYKLKMELQKIFDESFPKFDRVMIEVPPNVLTEFTNLLSDKAFDNLIHTQVDATKYVFSEQEFSI